MDQLKIVLEHKFWILAGLAVLLPPIGWWAATGNIAEETDSRTKKIESSEKSLGTVKDVPNEQWIQGAKEIGKELSASVAESQQHLFQHQQAAMKFPPYVQRALDKCHLKYRQDGTTADFFAAKEFFVGCYAGDWKNAIDVVKPYQPTTGQGLVLLPLEMTVSSSDVPPITRHYEVETWRQTLGFTATQMYDVQEDVWFLHALMEAIAKVNEGTTEIGNSRIKRVLEAVLRGGDPADLATRQNPKPGTSGTSGAAPAASRGMSVSVGALGHGRGGGGAEFSYRLPKPFDADDVFGADGSKDSGAPTSKKDVAGAVELKRWVDAQQKYNKRGFVLKLVMDEREIPTLLAALSESPFPVEIRHVEHQTYTGRSGAELSQITNAFNAMNENTEGVEQTKEQKQQQQRIIDGLRMAFNMNYLAEVTVAGTLTIYNEPAAATSKSTATAKTGAAQAPATSAPSSSQAAGQKTAPATSKAAPATTKSPSTSQGKTPPSAASAAKPGSPAAPSSSGKAAPAGNSSAPKK